VNLNSKTLFYFTHIRREEPAQGAVHRYWVHRAAPSVSHTPHREAPTLKNALHPTSIKKLENPSKYVKIS